MIEDDMNGFITRREGDTDSDDSDGYSVGEGATMHSVDMSMSGDENYPNRREHMVKEARLKITRKNVINDSD